MIKILLIGILLLKLCLTAFSQQPQRIVTGTITDAETGEPVQSAAVFIANTTVGTTTDMRGNYRLPLPGGGNYEMVFSHVGYEAVFHQINAQRALTVVNVKLNLNELDDIVITAERNYRNADVILFWDRLLGVKPLKYIEVLNPNDVHFHYNAETQILKVSSNKPIEIINNETGYHIYYTLNTFLHDYKTNITHFRGVPFYRPLVANNNRRQRSWESNRQQIYNVSLTHFVRSLYHNSLHENGFILNYLAPSNPIKYVTNLSDYVITDTVSGNIIFRSKPDTLLILTSIGKPVNTRELRRQKERLSVVRPNSVIQTVGSDNNQDVIIFSDGTYLGPLWFGQYRSANMFTNLRMMLPIEYGMPKNNDYTAEYVANIEQRHFTNENNENKFIEYSEKIYLTTDRSMYAAGDTVWISAWVLNAATLEPTDKSRMLHVELIRPDGTILRHLVLETIDGLTFGQLVLPKNVANDALFRLRAYTRWSLNFDESYRFEKNIPIVQFRDNVWQGPKISETDRWEWIQLMNGRWAWQWKTGEQSDEEEVKTRVPEDMKTPSLDLQFLPESGRWITGLPSRMAFKAVAEDGLGVNIEGEIFNDLDEKVADFQSMHNGMGSVFLVPQSGRSYHARLFSGHTVDLPTPDTTGIVMTIQHANNDTLTLQLYFSPDIVQRGEPYYLAVCSRGAHIDAFEVTPLRTRITMQLLADDFQTGIARFTLLTKDGIPCNERLVFIDKDDQIKLQFYSSKESNAINLQLQANDAFGNPLHGIFTVSVTDSLYGSHDVHDACLRSQMLLSSDLKGKIENPGWYFQDRDSLRLQALDLVMKTHGWSGYSWKDVEKWEDMIVYEPETDRKVSGKLTNLLNRPAKDISVTLWTEGGESFFDNTSTDAQGRFSFEGLTPVENTMATVMASRKNALFNTFGLGIELDSQLITPRPAIEPLLKSRYSEYWENMLSTYRLQRQNDDRWLDSLMKRTDVNIIEELIVEGVRPVRGSWNLNGPGHADHVLYEDDIARYDRHDKLLDIIMYEFPQLKKVSSINKKEFIEEHIVLSEEDRIFAVDIEKLAPYDYPIWSFQGRDVIFILNGRTLPASLPAEDNWIFPSYLVSDLPLLANKFWNISANEIIGIEILDSPEYLWVYTQNHTGSTRPLIIGITTVSGSVNLERKQIGVARQHLHGFSIPKTFYVPKYYPEDIVSQAEYDIRPTLYWNPEVVTDRDGKAEIRFPIGEKPRSLQIRVEGTDLRGGIGSAVGELIIDN